MYLFTSGIDESIQIILLSRDVGNLEEAVVLVMEQKKHSRVLNTNNGKSVDLLWKRNTNNSNNKYNTNQNNKDYN